nr:unnamed protein product [Spirometra erinaceieuropaei]
MDSPNQYFAVGSPERKITELSANSPSSPDSQHLALENLQLRLENQRLLEQLHQQIHDIQRERESVRLRLIAVESDYDAQVKELQGEVISLREDVQSQRRLFKQTNQAHQEAMQGLSERNSALQESLEESQRQASSLTAKAKELQDQLISSRAAIQSHVQQIESLRAEISQLKESKASLERRLAAITEERDCLLNALSDAQQTTALLQSENANQLSVLSHQDNELAQLQEAAAVLKDQLETLGSRSSPRHHQKSLQGEGDTVLPGPSRYSQPHQSLLGELSDAVPAHQDQWWYKHVMLDPTMSEFYEDDGIEVDDDSLLAFSRGQTAGSGPLAMDFCNADESAVDDNEEGEGLLDLDPNLTFMNTFRTEVAEIYQQLRQMCVDFSAQSNGMSTERDALPTSRPGDWTPDQLALVEWDFRLASLRNVLTDLRYLLQDLTIPPPSTANAATAAVAATASSPPVPKLSPSDKVRIYWFQTGRKLATLALICVLAGFE